MERRENIYSQRRGEVNFSCCFLSISGSGHEAVNSSLFTRQIRTWMGVCNVANVVYPRKTRNDAQLLRVVWKKIRAGLVAQTHGGVLHWILPGESRKCRIQGTCFASEKSENYISRKLIRLQIYAVRASGRKKKHDLTAIGQFQPVSFSTQAPHSLLPSLPCFCRFLKVFLSEVLTEF